MIKTAIIVVIVVFMVLLLLIVNATRPPIQNGTNNTNITHSPYIKQLTKEQIIQNFNSIRNEPYNSKTNNCKTKSEKLARYLVNNGATGVKIVTINYKDNSVAHEIVEYNNTYYDLCNSECDSYKYSKSEYLEAVRNIGWTGIVVTSDYQG